MTPEELAKGMKDAITVHDSYCEIFIQRPFTLLPESSLPASRDDIKSAILVVAVVRRLRGELTSSLLADAKSLFVRLARFVAADRAAPAMGFDEVARNYSKSEKGIDDAVSYARALRAASIENATGPSSEDTIALANEFDERWARLQSQTISGQANESENDPLRS